MFDHDLGWNQLHYRPWRIFTAIFRVGDRESSREITKQIVDEKVSDRSHVGEAVECICCDLNLCHLNLCGLTACGLFIRACTNDGQRKSCKQTDYDTHFILIFHRTTPLLFLKYKRSAANFIAPES